jgi:hypothetical protein
MYSKYTETIRSSPLFYYIIEFLEMERWRKFRQEIPNMFH